jgi:prepilin-type N-terminal cleavage/methylation domain-containing protein
MILALLHNQVVRGTSATASPSRRAFTLIEVLIAVMLMSVIVLGLMAMFGETQRAFRTGITQVDVMGSGRAATEMMGREIEQAQATGLRNSINFYVGPTSAPVPGMPSPYLLLQSLPGTGQVRTNILQNILFCTRDGQEWKGIGYSVLYTNYIGTLFRYETNASQLNAPDVAMLSQWAFWSPPSRVIDGVVNLRVHTYDSLGRLLSPGWNYKVLPPDQCVFLPGGRGDDIQATFLSNALPAYVEIELGILEDKTADRARNMPLDVQRGYLATHAGQVQVFRQRIPIRNADRSVYQ